MLMKTVKMTSKYLMKTPISSMMRMVNSSGMPKAAVMKKIWKMMMIIISNS